MVEDMFKVRGEWGEWGEVGGVEWVGGHERGVSVEEERLAFIIHCLYPFR
jgi:hypothetical protein